MRNLYLPTLLFSLMILLSSNLTFAGGEEENENRLYNQGKRALIAQDYVSAFRLFSTLTKTDADNAEYQFLAGLSRYNSGVDKEKSIPYFERSIEKSAGEPIAEAYYYLGRAYLHQANYEKAEEALGAFRPYILMDTKSGKKLAEEIDLLLATSTNAQELMETPVEGIEIKNLEGINSLFPEYAPVFSADKEVLLFTSRRKNSTGGGKAIDNQYFEDIYVAKKVGDNWEVVTDKPTINKYLFDGYNTDKMDAGVVYTRDGKSLYIYRKDGIYKSLFENNTWSAPVEVEEINKGRAHVPSVSISTDGKTMYFVSNDKSSLGGRDIYSAQLQSDNTWGKPTNLGDVINTKGQDDAPFISTDGKTLYFSSNGRSGMGGYDIFKSTQNEDGTWSEPENIGFPINSPSDDIYFIMDEERKKAFFASSRNGSKGQMDIYEVDYNPPAVDISVDGLVVATGDNPISNIKVALIDAQTNEVVSETTTDAEGRYNLKAASDKAYKLRVDNDGPAPYENDLAIDKQTRDYTTFQLIELNDLENEKGKVYARPMKVRTVMYDIDQVTDRLVANDKLAPGNQFNNLANAADNKRFSKYYSYLNADNFKPAGAYSEIFDTVMVNFVDLSDLAEYQKYFGYNQNEVTETNDQFAVWMDQLEGVIATAGAASIRIEASASKVPTKTHRTNKRLAKLRANKAKKAVLQALKARGVETDALTFEEVPLVQGPAYKGDFEAGKPTYEKYQYINLKVSVPATGE